MTTATKAPVKTYISECSACRAVTQGWPEYCLRCGSGRLMVSKAAA